MANVPSGKIKYAKPYEGYWESYASYVPINNSFLSVGIGIKGPRESPEIIQIELMHRTKMAGRQVIKYDIKKNDRETYWTRKRAHRDGEVYCDNGPDILSEVVKASPEFPQVIKKHFNVEL